MDNRREYLEHNVKRIGQLTISCIASLGAGHVGSALSIGDLLAVYTAELCISILPVPG